MKIKNIQNGKTYKNYKELCIALEEKTLTSNSKKSQLKMWENYFSFQKQGQKFTITEIYDKPKGKLTKRGFVTDIEELILDLLVQQTNGRLFISKSKLFKELYMVNENYNYLRYNIPKLSLFKDISTQEIEEFYTLSRDSMLRSITTALNNLNNRKLIFWKNGITLCQVKIDSALNEAKEIKAERTIVAYDDYGNPEYEFNTIDDSNIIHREATNDEIRIVIEAERKALKELRFETESEVAKNMKWDEYQRLVNNELWDKLNVLYTYKSYEIIFNNEIVSDFWLDVKKFSIESMLKEAKQINLNGAMKNKMVENAELRYKKALELKENLNFAKHEHRIMDDYVDNIQELVKMLIDIDSEDIRREVSKIKAGRLKSKKRNKESL